MLCCLACRRSKRRLSSNAIRLFGNRVFVMMPQIRLILLSVALLFFGFFGLTKYKFAARQTAKAMKRMAESSFAGWYKVHHLSVEYWRVYYITAGIVLISAGLLSFLSILTPPGAYKLIDYLGSFLTTIIFGSTIVFIVK